MRMRKGGRILYWKKTKKKEAIELRDLPRLYRQFKVPVPIEEIEDEYIELAIDEARTVVLRDVKEEIERLKEKYKGKPEERRIRDFEEKVNEAERYLHRAETAREKGEKVVNLDQFLNILHKSIIDPETKEILSLEYENYPELLRFLERKAKIYLRGRVIYSRKEKG